MRKVFIIAEAGVNHNGSLERAIEMVDVACACGADAVKFQTFNAINLVTAAATKASYQKKHTDKDESSRQMLEKLELSRAHHQLLKSHCEAQGIQFMSSPFDLESAQLLAELGCPIIKIGSGELTNLPLLECIARLKKEVILSTGMANLDEVREALAVLRAGGMKKSDITLLHATTEYPTPFNEVNLNAMNTMAQTFGVQVGYSDHTKGVEVAVAAVALGACVIEKHFTLDRNLPGPDHQASLEPNELLDMVHKIRHIEQALGHGEKIPTACELDNTRHARKSIVASKPIKKGEVFSAWNLTTKRPASGLSPMLWHDLIGLKAEKDFALDECVFASQLMHGVQEDVL